MESFTGKLSATNTEWTILNPDAPADCKVVHTKCTDSGDIELKLVDDCNASFARLLIERRGTKVMRITIDGVVILDETE